MTDTPIASELPVEEPVPLPDRLDHADKYEIDWEPIKGEDEDAVRPVP